MSTRIVILTILGGILQLTSCLTVQEVLAEYKPKVKELQNEAIKIMQNSSREYRNASFTIGKEKRNATCIINKKIADLKNKVREFEKNATSEGINISKCVRNFKREIQYVSPCSSINRCSSYDFYKAHMVLQKLQCLVQDIGRITNSCLRKFPDDSLSEQLKECFEDSIKDHKETLEKHKTTFEEALKSALEEIRKCITESMAKLTEALEKIWANFEKCVQNLKPPPKIFYTNY